MSKQLVKTLQISLILLLITGIRTEVNAQDRRIYNWENNRSYTPGIENEEASLILVKDHMQYDYEFEQNDFVCYQTYHKIFRVNNDEALQRVNRIYIPLNGTIDITAVRARTITPDGKVVELDKENIKEVKDDEAGAGYRIFAIEGAEVGSDIEYFYTKKVNAQVFGREYVQYNYPVMNSSFRLTSPSHLKFEFKSYNGLNQVKQDESDMIKNAYEVSTENIPILRQELFGSYNSNRQRIEFKLSYNSAAGNKRLFTWNDAGNRIKSLIYPYSAAEATALDELLKELKVKKLASPEEQFAFVEHYVKSNFYIDDNASDAANKVDFVIKNQFGTELGFTRFFVALLDKLEIEHEVVLTQSRKEIRFDGNFESWNYLADYLIYLNNADQFMAPYHFENRLGLWPAEFSATYGLFIKTKATYEGTFASEAKIKQIPELPYTNNYDNLQIKVTFNENFSENAIDVERSFKGYDGSFFKSAYQRANEEQRTQLMENVIEYLSPDADIKEVKMAEETLDYKTWSEPFTVRSTFTAKGYIEQAGDIILFNVGELIGGQSELYQEYERTTQVENDYNRGYLRTIQVDIPEGYTIQNPQDIDMDVEASDNGKVVYLFKSNHEIKGNQLLITIDEYYDQIFFPLSRFEEFRKVINAAADWNKITLVLQPE